MDENEKLTAQAEVTTPIPIRRINNAKQTVSWQQHLRNQKAKARKARKAARAARRHNRKR